MVGVDNSSLQADPRPKSAALVQRSVAVWCCSSHQINCNDRIIFSQQLEQCCSRSERFSASNRSTCCSGSEKYSASNRSMCCSRSGRYSASNRSTCCSRSGRYSASNRSTCCRSERSVQIIDNSSVTWHAPSSELLGRVPVYQLRACHSCQLEMSMKTDDHQAYDLYLYSIWTLWH